MDKLRANRQRGTRYKQLGEIARGGMGAILKIWDDELRRTLAMKVVLTRREIHAGEDPSIDPRMLNRFLEEAQVTGQLDHPGIVPIHELGLASDGRVYFTMRLVHGEDLHTIFEKVLTGEDGWGQVRALGVMLKVCDAVSYAHSKQVVHRDLKPANVMVGKFGEVYVMDWGLARVLGREDEHDPKLPSQLSHSFTQVSTERREERDAAPDSPLVTMDGDVVGTPSFMSPEQARGQLEKLGARSDVYAVGAMLYQLIAGEMPYRKRGEVISQGAILMRLLEGPPTPLHELAPKTPAELVAIVEKAMARDASQRYTDMPALADDLRAYIEGRVVRAHETGAWAEAKKWVQRNKPLAASLAAALVLLVAGLATSLVLKSRADEAKRNKTRTLADSYSTLGLIAADDGDTALAALWFANAVGQSEGEGGRDSINRIRVRNWTADGIFAPIAAIDLPDLIKRLEFHPSGRYLAGRTGEGHCMVWDLTTSSTWECPPAIEKLTAVAWDRTGTRIVLGGQDKAGVFAFPSGEAIRTWDWTGQVTAAAFNPAGTKLALGGATVRLWDLESDRVASPDWELPLPLHAIAFTPDGSRVVTAGTDGIMRVYAALGERSEPEFTTPNLSYGPPQFLDGGTLVVTFPTDNSASGVDLASGKEKFHVDVRKYDGWEFKVAASPDGKSLWSPGWIEPDVLAWDSAGRSIAVDLAHLNKVFSLAFSPDGSMLASGAWDRTLRIWDVKTQTLRYPELTSISSPTTVAWSPDGRQIAAAYESRALRVWSLPSGLPIRTIETGGAISMARFAPDGRSLLPHSGSNHRASQRQIQQFDPATGKPNSALVDTGETILAADVSTDGRRLVTATTRVKDRTEESPELGTTYTPEAGAVRFWNVSSGQPEGAPVQVPSEPRDVRFRPDGSEAAVICAGREVLILEPSSGQINKTFETKLKDLTPSFHVGNHQLCYSRDGQRLYVYSPNGPGLQILNADSGETLFSSGLEVFDLRESSDGSILAVAYGRNDFTVRQFDTRTFQELAPQIPHPDWVFSVRFDSTENRLLTACRDRAARLWDRKTGELLAIFNHENEVVAAELFGDDRFVVSVGHDEVARIFDAETGRPIGPPIELGGLGLSIDVSRDRRWAVMGGFTNRLTVLDLEAIIQPSDMAPQQLLRQAELMAGRRIDAHGGVVNLTVDEWKDRWEEYRLRER